MVVTPPLSAPAGTLASLLRRGFADFFAPAAAARVASCYTVTYMPRMASGFNRSGQLDSAALALSALCMVHCVAGLWLVAGIASLTGLLFNPLWHEAGLVLAAFLAALALGHGAMRHGSLLPLAIGSLGIGVMAGALSLPDGGEAMFTVFGVALLGAGHLLNARAALA